jgi:hypothetical protein
MQIAVVLHCLENGDKKKMSVHVWYSLFFPNIFKQKGLYIQSVVGEIHGFRTHGCKRWQRTYFECYLRSILKGQGMAQVIRVTSQQARDLEFKPQGHHPQKNINYIEITKWSFSLIHLNHHFKKQAAICWFPTETGISSLSFLCLLHISRFWKWNV